MKTLIFALLFFVSCLFSASASAVQIPLNLNFTMTEANFSALNFGPSVNPNTGTQAINAPSFNFNMSVTTPADRTSATFSGIELSFGLPYTRTGEFDLGFFGEFPWEVAFDTVTISFADFTVPLSGGGSFLPFAHPGTAHVEGDVIVNGGNPVAFQSDMVGGFIISGLFDTTLVSTIIFNGTISLGFVATSPIWSGTINGQEASLSATIPLSASFTDNSNNLPEPSTAILLGVGLAGLSFLGRSK